MDIFLARQPIFDQDQRVVAYELLYRDDGEARSAGDGGDAERSSDVIVNAVLGIGLGQITGGHKAYINLSADQLLGGEWRVLDPDSVVIELLEGIEPTDEVLAACREMVAEGYVLALDDYRFREGDAELLELAEIVKVDVLEIDPATLEVLPTRLEPFGVTLLAEKVENRKTHERCRELGFQLFQGFHYFRPETLSKKDLSTESVGVVRLLNLLRDMDVTDKAIEEAFRSDPALTYKLLRMVNSAAMAGRGVQSIRHALRLLGREPLYRWLSLLLISRKDGDGGEIRTEMIKSALVRGRMCELLDEGIPRSAGRSTTSGSLFLVGLFSHLDVLLDIPLDRALDQIDTTENIRSALLEGNGRPGTLLDATIAYQDGEWEKAERVVEELGGDAGLLPDTWLESLTWASQRMSMRTDLAA